MQVPLDAADTTDPGPSTPANLSHREILIVFSALMLGVLLASLDQTVVSTALPTIVGELGGLDHLSWVVTAYLLTSTASVPLYGKISDLYGRKIVFQAAILFFLIGSLLAGAAQNMAQLIAFRGIQGIGGGGLMAMSMAIIGDIVSPRQRGRYSGYLGGVFAFSSIAGPLMGGFFTDHLSWRWLSISSLLAFLIAAGMFGGVVFLPLFLQVVTGASATASGLLLLPLMAGVLSMSIVSGKAITATGHYRRWPILGAALATVGMAILSRLDASSSPLDTSLGMLVLGLGLGMTMQVLVLIVQNAAPYRDLGVATSAVNFFRSMGGAFGVAIFGAVMTARLTAALPPGVDGAVQTVAEPAVEAATLVTASTAG